MCRPVNCCHAATCSPAVVDARRKVGECRGRALLAPPSGGLPFPPSGAEMSVVHVPEDKKEGFRISGGGSGSGDTGWD